MKYLTAHNRTVYASLLVGGSGYGTLYEMAAKLVGEHIDKKFKIMYKIKQEEK
jgi:hypothetical protein